VTTAADRLLRRIGGPWMTHASLLVATLLYYGLLATVPFWIAFVPCVYLGHRIGILLHEYFHGLGFRRYRVNQAVVTLWDGLMLTFGMLEVLRARHLDHHREVAGAGRRVETDHPQTGLDVARYFTHLADGLRGRLPYVHPRRIGLGAVISTAMIASCVLLGRSDVMWSALAVVVFTVTVPVSLRSAMEHQGEAGADRFANDYRAVVPMFNVNRHIHHHEDATVPWYRLEWRAGTPLSPRAYLTHWYRAHVTGELSELPPMGHVAERDHAGR
jgi:fatty acid desaturase